MAIRPYSEFHLQNEFVSLKPDFVICSRSHFATAGPVHSSTRKRIYILSIARGINDVHSKDFAAKSKQACMSSGVSPSYSFKISERVAPCAIRLRIYSTLRRVPRMTGFPAITLGFKVFSEAAADISLFQSPHYHNKNELAFTGWLAIQSIEKYIRRRNQPIRNIVRAFFTNDPRTTIRRWRRLRRSDHRQNLRNRRRIRHRNAIRPAIPHGSVRC